MSGEKIIVVAETFFEHGRVNTGLALRVNLGAVGLGLGSTNDIL